LSRCDVVLAILAADASRRLGTAKQLVPIGGEALLRRQCRSALAADIGPAVVILGCDAAQHARVIADLPIEVVVNNQWTEGMAASLRCAVDVATDRQAACLILPCDQYRITSSDLQELAAMWRQTPGLACVSRWAGYSGPPAILPMAYYDGIQRLRGNIGARGLLQDSRRPKPQEIANERAIYDLDSPEDVPIAQQWAEVQDAGGRYPEQHKTVPR
jgi:molybdenum cofactor cytidylyltransferase